MPNNERIIPPVISEDGSVHYSSVTSAPDDSTAVCYMVPDRVIPIIFVPGVMGTNLKAIAGPYARQKIWVVDGALSVAVSWIGRGAKTRKQKLDPSTTAVYDGGDIPGGTQQKEAELRRRGWGTVAKMSYGTFLPMLENALNDAGSCKTGLRASLMKLPVANAPGVSVLSFDEVALSYKYYMPVHAVGYNWLQSNADSAKHLGNRIKEFIDYYKKRRKVCEKVIIVTHSMGGLVARYYSEVDGNRDDVLGMVHAVMPTTGSATAYKRVTTGTEGSAGLALGPDSATMTPVFGQAPGPLQLLPGVDYGMGWLKIRRGKQEMSLPTVDPYKEIYLQRGKWWSLINDKLLNPLNESKKNIDSDWAAYVDLISNSVRPFHEVMRGKFHSMTYAFYGDDNQHKTWGDVVWETTQSPAQKCNDSYEEVDNLEDGKVFRDGGRGIKSLIQRSGDIDLYNAYELLPASENGDGTVPIRSGSAPRGHVGVRACVSYKGVDHEGAYRNLPQQLFALWAVTRIVGKVKGTQLEYKQ